MACSSLLVESFLLSKKDNWTFNELYVVGGIPPAVAVLQESWHLHTVLYHYIASYRVFVPVVRSFFPKAPLHILSIDAAS